GDPRPLPLRAQPDVPGDERRLLGRLALAEHRLGRGPLPPGDRAAAPAGDPARGALPRGGLRPGVRRVPRAGVAVALAPRLTLRPSNFEPETMSEHRARITWEGATPEF